MSLARLIPISYANRNSARAHEIILDYNEGYMYFKNTLGDVLPVRTAGYDRTFSILNYSNKIFKSGYTNPDLKFGDFYGGVGSTTISNYNNGGYRVINPDIEESDAVSFFDEDFGDNSYAGGNNYGVVGRLSKQLLSGYTVDPNHLYSTSAAIMAKDKKRNASLGLPDDALTVILPLTIANNVMVQSFAAGVGTKLISLSNMLTTMQSDIESRLLATEINKYLPKGVSWSTDDTTAYKDLKAVITAIANRYTKSESDSAYLPFGAATFNTDNKYAGLRDAKAIVDYMLTLNKSIGDGYIPYAANADELTTYKSTAPYNNFLTMKALIDQLIFKGTGWDPATSPYKDYPTMKAIADGLYNRYTKAESNSAYANKAYTFLKATTDTDLANYNSDPKYKVFVTGRHLIDAILDRYTKTESDDLLAKKLEIADTDENRLIFNEDNKYTGYRTAKDIVDKLQSDYAINGGTLSSGYETMKELGDKIATLEGGMMSAMNPLSIKCVGAAYGQIFGYMDNMGSYRNSPDDGILNEILINSTMAGSIINKKSEDPNIVPIRVRRHFGGKYIFMQRLRATGIYSTTAMKDPDEIYNDSIYTVPAFNALTTNTSDNNDLKVLQEFSDAETGFYPTFIDLSNGTDLIAVEIMTNKLSKYMHILAYKISTGTIQLYRRVLCAPDAVGLTVTLAQETGSELSASDLLKDGKEEFVLGDYGLQASLENKFYQTLITYNKLVIFKLEKYSKKKYESVELVRVSGATVGTGYSGGQTASTVYKVYKNGVLLGPQRLVAVSSPNSTNISLNSTKYMTNANGEITVYFTATGMGAVWGGCTATFTDGVAMVKKLYPNDQILSHSLSVGGNIDLAFIVFNESGEIITATADTLVRITASLPAYSKFTGNSAESTGTSFTNPNSSSTTISIKPHTDGKYIFNWSITSGTGATTLTAPSEATNVITPYYVSSVVGRAFGGNGVIRYAESFMGRVDGCIWTFAVKDDGLYIRSSSSVAGYIVADVYVNDYVTSTTQLLYVSRLKNAPDSESSSLLSFYFIDTATNIISKLDVIFGTGTATPIHRGAICRLPYSIQGNANYRLERDWEGDIIRLPRDLVNPYSNKRAQKVYKISDEI